MFVPFSAKTITTTEKPTSKKLQPIQISCPMPGTFDTSHQELERQFLNWTKTPIHGLLLEGPEPPTSFFVIGSPFSYTEHILPLVYSPLSLPIPPISSHKRG